MSPSSVAASSGATKRTVSLKARVPSRHGGRMSRANQKSDPARAVTHASPSAAVAFPAWCRGSSGCQRLCPRCGACYLASLLVRNDRATSWNTA